MFKKIICFALTCSALLLSGCSNTVSDNLSEIVSGNSSENVSDSPSKGFEMKSLSEIRSETGDISVLDSKFDNLDLSKTYFYVPDVDKMGGISIDYDISTEDKKKLILDTAEWIIDEAADENNMYYFSANQRHIPYAECKDDPQRAEYVSIFYENDKILLNLELYGSSICFGNKAVDDFPNKMEGVPRWIFYSQDDLTENYDLRVGENGKVELQDGETDVSEAMDFLRSHLESSPFHIDGLKLIPNKAKIYKVGEKYGINALFMYEYNGVLLDHHSYSRDLETGKYDAAKAHIQMNASTVWKNSVDQLYYSTLGTVKPTDDSFDEFISLEDFLSMMSEKLTGNSVFTIDSIELLYGLERYTLSIATRPMWVAYISRTGISDAPQMCLTADAVTGEFDLYRSNDL